MFDIKRNCWVASGAPADAAEGSLAADFAIADAALERVSDGPQNVEAVYLMETAAKVGYAPACLAMAELFKYGWAVGKSKKLWYYWTEQAANAGDEGAKAIVEKHKKAKRRARLITAAACVAVIAAVAGVVWYIATMPKVGSTRISLPHGVELGEIEDFDEKIDRAQKLREEYDSNDIKSGEAAANRILLIYTGKSLNLSKFKVVAAMTDGEMITLQFNDAAEAERCYTYLYDLPETQFISMDRYYQAANQADEIDTLPVTSHDFGVTPYHSPYSGCDYYSWGVEAMEMDRYAAYLAEALPGKEAVVAVIDSGVEPNDETKDRILEGKNVVTGGNGQKDPDGHGTHVSGTILDATRGLNVKILPVTPQMSISYNDRESYEKALLQCISTICTALDYAIEQKVQVVNMSLGFECPDEKSVLHYYLDKAIKSGITVVVAAGNNGDDASSYCPAHHEACITVAANDANGDPADFSNYGSAVDVIAPGVAVLSYVPAPDYMDVYQGTSMASPHVAALAVMLWLEYEPTPANMERFIRAYCDGKVKDSRDYGEGMPKAGFFVETVG